MSSSEAAADGAGGCSRPSSSGSSNRSAEADADRNGKLSRQGSSFCSVSLDAINAAKPPPLVRMGDLVVLRLYGGCYVGYTDKRALKYSNIPKGVGGAMVAGALGGLVLSGPVGIIAGIGVGLGLGVRPSRCLCIRRLKSQAAVFVVERPRGKMGPQSPLCHGIPFRLRLVSGNGSVSGEAISDTYVTLKELDGRVAMTRQTRSSACRSIRTVSATPRETAGRPQVRFGDHVYIYVGLLREPDKVKWVGARTLPGRYVDSNVYLAVDTPDSVCITIAKPEELSSKDADDAAGARGRTMVDDDYSADQVKLDASQDDGEPLKSAAAPPPPPPSFSTSASVSFSIFAYNVWMMPKIVTSTAWNVSIRKHVRAKLIPKAIPHEETDVIVLSEAFCNSARPTLLAGLKAAGFVFEAPVVGIFRSRNPSRLKPLSGGVVAVSKYPIEETAARYFGDESTGSDAMAEKGCLYIKVRKQGLAIHVFTSHLQAWSSDRAIATREAQLYQMRSFVDEMVPPGKNEPVVFAGDFNVDRYTEPGDYGRMLQLLEATDTFDPSAEDAKSLKMRSSTGSAHSTDSGVMVDLPSPDEKCEIPTSKYSFDAENNYLAAHGPSSDDGKSSLYDYVLHSKSTTHLQPTSCSSKILILKTKEPYTRRGHEYDDLSDHFPILAKFEFPFDPI